MTIADFLLARIDEDEKAAREIYPPGAWRTDEYEDIDEFVVVGPPPRGTRRYDQGEPGDEVDIITSQDEGLVGHIARWSPYRVLAECAAKRRIVDRHARRRTILPGAPWVEFGWNSSGLAIKLPDGSTVTGAVADALYDEWSEPSTGDTLRALAAVYADHPDFDPAWGVDG